jgi:hypothetical protein
MMDLVIHSDNEEIRDLFRGLNRSKQYRILFFPKGAPFKESVENSGNTIIYFDISDWNVRAIKKGLRTLSSLGCPWAIIDPQGLIEDSAELFHLGACDYLPPCQLTVRLKAARIHRVVDFLKAFTMLGESDDTADTNDCDGVPIIPSGTDWNSIQQGNEYTFYFLYIELTPSKEWQVKSDDKNKKDFQIKFEQAVRRRIEPAHGKVWMWNEWGGLILFPFTAQNAQPVIIATRMILNRPLISIEEIKASTLVDYRIAFHLGNTTYHKRGYTGEIISDDINFIFHLGKKRIEENTLYITERAYPQIPTSIRSLLLESQSFEGRRLYRMKNYLFG